MPWQSLQIPEQTSVTSVISDSVPRVPSNCRERQAEGVSMEHLTLVMSADIPCPEYTRLRWEYEVALRRWGDLLLAQLAEPVGWDFKRAVELRKNAVDEKDATDKRLEDHKRSCPVCREAIRHPHT